MKKLDLFSSIKNCNNENIEKKKVQIDDIKNDLFLKYNESEINQWEYRYKNNGITFYVFEIFKYNKLYIYVFQKLFEYELYNEKDFNSLSEYIQRRLSCPIKISNEIIRDFTCALGNNIEYGDSKIAELVYRITKSNSRTRCRSLYSDIKKYSFPVMMIGDKCFIKDELENILVNKDTYDLVISVLSKIDNIRKNFYNDDEDINRFPNLLTSKSDDDLDNIIESLLDLYNNIEMSIYCKHIILISCSYILMYNFQKLEEKKSILEKLFKLQYKSIDMGEVKVEAYIKYNIDNDSKIVKLYVNNKMEVLGYGILDEIKCSDLFKFFPKDANNSYDSIKDKIESSIKKFNPYYLNNELERLYSLVSTNPSRVNIIEVIDKLYFPRVMGREKDIFSEWVDSVGFTKKEMILFNRILMNLNLLSSNLSTENNNNNSYELLGEKYKNELNKISNIDSIYTKLNKFISDNKGDDYGRHLAWIILLFIYNSFI